MRINHYFENFVTFAETFSDIKMELQDKVAYIIAVVSEFADAHSLKPNQAYRYLLKFDGIGFVDRHYEVEHTLPFDDVVKDLTDYCHRKGGML